MTELRYFSKYAIVGLLNTLFGYAIYAFCVWAGLHFFSATLVTMVVNVGVGFLLQGVVVFQNLSRKALLRYIVMWLALLAMYNLIVFLVVLGGGNAYIGGLVALGPVVICSFLAQRFMVFAND